MLLAEEFAVNPNFANWFVSKTKFNGAQSTVLDVFVSKSNNLGESDLIVLLDRGIHGRVGILIEDKVDASIQPSQAERYRLRADQDVRAGEWTDYEIILCAPRSYLEIQKDAKTFDSAISLEEIANFLSTDSSARSKYRADFLGTAATKRKNAWKREQDDATDAFWNAAYEIAVRDFPILEMKRPEFTKGSSSPVFVPSWLTTQPKNKYLWIKGSKGFCDLTFDNTTAYKFKNQISEAIPAGITIHQTGKAAVIRMEVLPFAVSEGVEVGLPKVRRAFEACEKLARFYCANQSLIDDGANKSTPLK